MRTLLLEDEQIELITYALSLAAKDSFNIHKETNDRQELLGAPINEFWFDKGNDFNNLNSSIHNSELDV